jgi:hypothetical protein
MHLADVRNEWGLDTPGLAEEIVEAREDFVVGE